jgi:UDP-N-acetyl-D-mannosaminuronic acid dehydrogenase
MHVPGAGVGGHCLPKDPWLLVDSGREANPKLIPTARAVNDSMPFHVLDLAASALDEAGRTLDHSVVAVMGASFLQDSGDPRNSPSMPVIESLKGAKELRVHDPFLDSIAGIDVTNNWKTALEGADLAIFMVSHKVYSRLSASTLRKLMRTPVVVDGRNIFHQGLMEKAGVLYKGVGKRVSA